MQHCCEDDDCMEVSRRMVNKSLLTQNLSYFLSFNYHPCEHLFQAYYPVFASHLSTGPYFLLLAGYCLDHLPMGIIISIFNWYVHDLSMISSTSYIVGKLLPPDPYFPWWQPFLLMSCWLCSICYLSPPPVFMPE